MSATSAAKKEEKQCTVCIEKYTRVIRQPIECPYCPDTACRQCTSQYLLTTQNDPHCMHCKREWNREFIDLKLTNTFRKGALKDHRQKVLMNREKARLPAMQVYVEAHHTIQAEAVKRNEYILKKKELKKERNKIQSNLDKTLAPDEIIQRLRPIQDQLRQTRKYILDCDRRIYEAQMLLNGGEVKEARQFIMKCPGEECRGFLSTAWKCGTCQKYYCHDCHAVKTDQKDDSHVCNEEAKATASMISKETRGCPKCGIRISKIEGCDQMFCTSCHAVFSWNTGQLLLNTVIHNPHYYEYLRQKNNGVVPRELGDVPCGGLPNPYLFARAICYGTSTPTRMIHEITDILRCLHDIQNVRLPRFPLRQPANMNQELDIRYLMNQLTEEQWGAELEKKETKFERNKEIGLILQTLIHVGAEKLTAIQNETRQSIRRVLIESAIKEMNDVRQFTNTSLIQKGKQMGIVVPYISIAWSWSWISREQMKQEKLADNLITAESLLRNYANPQGEVEQQKPEPQEQPQEQLANPLFVEMDGEMVEMTLEQAREILGV